MKDRIYRFASFELNLAEGELRTGNSKILLQEKPLRLLSALLDNPQRLVTREQLRERMWDERTVVNFEQGINVAIKKVRDALGDSAERPIFIATVAKKGYRLMVPVEVVSEDVQIARMPVAAMGLPLDASLITGPAAEALAAKPIRRRLILGTVAAGMLIAVGLGVLMNRAQSRRPSPSQVRSLAVLPLQDLSPQFGQEYFADGITEEVITNLAQTLPVRVISRSSVMRFKRTDKSIAEIARELGVDAIVEGAVTRSGDRVRVSVDLIDASQDRHLWAQTYDRRLEDILGIEAEVSRAIATQVTGTLQQAKLIESRPVDPQVYELILMGRYHWNKRTAADLAKAQDYFQQAILRDPNYAPAHAGLAKVYALLPQVGASPVRENLAKATSEARRALELDEGLAEAHATLAFVALNTTPEWKHSEPEFRRALNLDLNDSITHLWFAYYFMFSERREQALAEITVARQLDPLSPLITENEGHLLYGMRRFKEARERLQRAIELAPELGQPHASLALVELETGHPADALREAHTAVSLDADSPRVIGEAGYVLAASGHTAESQILLTALEARHGGISMVYCALIQMGLGQREQAFQTLKRSAAEGLQGISQWHAFDELRADSRYREILAKTQ
jgi:TolB-like protein/DNA-binding winged helix-turn-helix (wHTH) protein/Tfp pilus assembly protein PilF